MASLKSRLGAYNKKPISTQSPTTKPQLIHTTTHVARFTKHPISGTELLLPHSVARDFTGDVETAQLLFFDLETTGLGASEQVYPFLIGAARQLDGACELTTWFADTPAGEEEMLAAFITQARDTVLVSFNGKSFDLPLVLRRAEKYGLANSLKDCIHIDLFHTIRRIFPEKPARLVDAEARLLQFTRAGDISGAAVAQAYFEYLHFGKSNLRSAILQHNVSDVLSLVSLLARVSTAFHEARRGEHSWAYKIHRDKSANLAQQKQLLEKKSANALDGRDLQALAIIYRKEKNYRHAARLFLKAYRHGKANAIVDAVRSVKRCGHATLARRLTEYALAREDERVQRQLVRLF
ncbi:MAG: ribonuclease H-like domain-containing protein [Spirochaetes bacterium]|nr:ribonuclease H-like domain-containing protein [Spirochaetota bacterium]